MRERTHVRRNPQKEAILGISVKNFLPKFFLLEERQEPSLPV
jgi:hypothetical protein